MKISLDWLRDLVTWNASPAELAERLTSAGLNVEHVAEIALTFPGVVVARVVACERHPAADRLSLCRVDAGGDEPVQVVCGAPNVREGLSVYFAQVGAVLPGDFRIKKAKIRGVESHGMICSESELGLSAESSGIMELRDAPAPGTSADTLIGFRDTVLDIEVTPNRPDWLSHIGVAREVAALYGTKVTLPPTWSPQQSGSLGWKVEVASFGDCPRYTAHGADEVAVAPSPRWMQNRLRAVGQRPINNVVDITNYVLLELGQPLHAFDREKLQGDTLRVRRAGTRQTVVTLDDVSREIDADDLVIADANGPVALAGVMGLANSEVTPGSTSILLESAFFAPLLVRRTSRRLNLVSESSYRFEREADWDMVRFAAHRALALLQDLAGATIVSECVDRADPERRPHPDLPLRVSQVNRVLGTDISVEEAAGLVQRLGLKVQPLGGSRGANVVNMMVAVPSFRRDLVQEVDLIEEIARTHGLDRGAGKGRARGGSGVARRLGDRVQAYLRHHLAAVGYHEIVTSTFFTRRDLEALALPADDVRSECLAVLSPDHGGETLLRSSLVPSFIDVARRNLNAGATSPVRLFQINRVYWPRGERPHPRRHDDERLLPEEPLVLQLGLAGDVGPGLGDLPGDLVELKGLVGELAAALRVALVLEPTDVEPYLVAGQQWAVLDGAGRRVGTAGRLAASVTGALDLDQPVALAEITLSSLDLTPATTTYRAFVRFPAVKRDLSLLVPAGVTYARVAAVLRESGGTLLTNLELFDIYRGKGLPPDMSAYGIRLKFQSDKGNLTGERVDQTLAGMLGALGEQLGVQQRS